MSYNVLIFPDDNLRLVADEHTTFDEELKQIVEKMFETMYLYKGIGLASTQVNLKTRIVVIDVTDDFSQQLTLINPVIVSYEGSTAIEEGCLSIPGFNALVPRHEKVTINYQDVEGNTHTLEADDLLAICIQHEIDHLNGKLFVDYISDLQREQIRKKLIKEKKALKREAKNKK